MHVNLGLDAYTLSQRNERRPVTWRADSAINGHWLICGGSGTGKTYTVRRVLGDMLGSATTPVRIHIFDVHGDLDLGPDASSVRFSEASEHGFNPLIVNPDPHFGGVRRKIQGLLAALNRTSRALGPKQEAVLRAILTDLYAANGFYADKPASWSLKDGVTRTRPKRHPALQDAIRFTAAKLKALYLGADSKTVAALEELNSLMRRLGNASRAAGSAGLRGDTDTADQKQAAVEALAAKAKDAFAAHIDSLRTGREFDDLIRYDSRDTLKSVLDRLENLHSIGIFKPEIPPFDPNARVWRYDLTSLPSDESKLFVWFRLESIFANAMQRGVTDGVRDVIVLDEAHRYASSSNDDDTNPVDTIAREARKFGVGLMGISQAPSHFSEDFLSNVATKVILGLDEMFWDPSVRKLKIPEKTLRFIRPKRTMAVQIKTPGDVRNTFFEVAI